MVLWRRLVSDLSPCAAKLVLPVTDPVSLATPIRPPPTNLQLLGVFWAASHSGGVETFPSLL